MWEKPSSSICLGVSIQVFTLEGGLAMSKIFYGIEALIDASDCDPSTMNRENIGAFIEDLCDRIDMEPALETFYWDEENGGATDEPHLKGTSAFRFIETSNIVIHTLTALRVVFVNIFSCKMFESEDVEQCIKEYFGAKKLSSQVVKREYEDS